jgi:hypothetical protein
LDGCPRLCLKKARVRDSSDSIGDILPKLIEQLVAANLDVIEDVGSGPHCITRRSIEVEDLLEDVVVRVSLRKDRVQLAVGEVRQSAHRDPFVHSDDCFGRLDCFGEVHLAAKVINSSQRFGIKRLNALQRLATGVVDLLRCHLCSSWIAESELIAGTRLPKVP